MILWFLLCCFIVEMVGGRSLVKEVGMHMLMWMCIGSFCFEYRLTRARSIHQMYFSTCQSCRTLLMKIWYISFRYLTYRSNINPMYLTTDLIDLKISKRCHFWRRTLAPKPACSDHCDFVHIPLFLVHMRARLYKIWPLGPALNRWSDDHGVPHG